MNWKRTVRSTVSGMAAILGVVTLGPPAYVLSQDALNRALLEQEATRLEKALTESSEVEVVMFAPPPGGYERPPHPLKESLKDDSPYMTLKALEGLEEALRYYPKGLLKKHLQQIEIVKAYLTSTEEIEKQGATPVAYMSFWGGMSISAGRDDWNRYHRAVLGTIFEAEAFHHEIAHELTNKIPEEDWRAIQPEAKYDSATWRSRPTIPPGFFNRYATHSIREDIASTTELLYSREYEKRVAKDPILKRKAECLKEWYLNISNGVMDENYWETVQKGEIPTF